MAANRARFTEEENDYLKVNFLAENIAIGELGPKKYIEVDGRRVSRLDDFLDRVTKDFVENFPYRSPKTPKKKIRNDLRPLQYRKEEWEQQFRQRLRNRFNQLKRKERDEKQSERSGRDGSGSDEESQPGDADGSEGEESEIGDSEDDRGDSQSRHNSDPGSGQQTSGAGPSASKAPEQAYSTHPPGSESESDTGQINSSRDSTDHGDTDSIASDRPLLKYAPARHTKQAWKRSLTMLNNFRKSNWAECAPMDLKYRQNVVSDILGDVLDIMSYSTNAEIHATGALMSQSGPQNFSYAESLRISTPRSESYARTENGIDGRTNFTNFVLQYIGPSLCTSRSCPAPAIYAASATNEHPTFPVGLIATFEQKQRLLWDYFSYQLQYQGGSWHVPYDLIEEEYHRGESKIVKQSVLPECLPYLKHPMKMNEEEVSAMTEHLIEGDNGGLSDDRRFCFEQWNDVLSESFVPREETKLGIVYRPNTLAFARAMDQVHLRGESETVQASPPIPSSFIAYESFNDAAMATYRQALADSDLWWGLHSALSEHDAVYPVQATIEFWRDRVADMPHIRSELPLPESAGNHIVSKRGFLPVQWFDWRDEQHRKWNLPAVLQWCKPSRWTDDTTDTIIGGMMGVKWPTALLAHVRRNVRRFEQEPGEWLQHYARYRGSAQADSLFSFEEGQLRQINGAIEDLRLALTQSTERLRHSHEARRARRPDEQVIDTSTALHMNFPTCPDQFQLVEHGPTMREWRDEEWEAVTAEFRGPIDPTSSSDIPFIRGDLGFPEVIIGTAEGEPGARKNKRAAPSTPPTISPRRQRPKIRSVEEDVTEGSGLSEKSKGKQRSTEDDV